MALPVFVYSPLPANLSRQITWNGNVQRFDSGVRQGITAFIKPLYNYTLNIAKMTEINQSSLEAFYNNRQGTTLPFLMKDPYNYRTNSIVVVRSGITTGSLYTYDTNSWTIRVDTTTIGSLFSTLSGYVTLGSEFDYSQDNGILTVNLKNPTDIWSIRSGQYFKKVAFENDYRDTSILWNVFNISGMQVNEIP